MDEVCSRAVRKAFVDLYNKQLLYRGNRLVNWCPRCSTALADIEVEHNDNKGHLWHIRYPIVDRRKKTRAAAKKKRLLTPVYFTVPYRVVLHMVAGYRGRGTTPPIFTRIASRSLSQARVLDVVIRA